MTPRRPDAPVRVLVAGATGFVGSHVVRHVAGEGHRVLAIAHRASDGERIPDGPAGVSWIAGDLARLDDIADDLRDFAPRACIDCAWGDARSGDASSGHVASLSNALALAERLIDIGCPRYVHAGTCFEYEVSGAPHREEDPTRPHTVYGACKRAAGAAIEALGGRTGRLSVAWPRIFYVYGPHEPPGRLVPAVIRGLLAGEPTATTAGAQLRDYLHVEDVAAALWTVAGSGHRGPINVASGEAVPVAVVVRTLGRLLGREDLLDLGGLPYRPEEPAAVRADVRRLRALGWRPGRSLEEGLRHTIDWWRLAGGDA